MIRKKYNELMNRAALSLVRLGWGIADLETKILIIDELLPKKEKKKRAKK